MKPWRIIFLVCVARVLFGADGVVNLSTLVWVGGDDSAPQALASSDLLQT